MTSFSFALMAESAILLFLFRADRSCYSHGRSFRVLLKHCANCTPSDGAIFFSCFLLLGLLTSIVCLQWKVFVCFNTPWKVAKGRSESKQISKKVLRDNVFNAWERLTAEIGEGRRTKRGEYRNGVLKVQTGLIEHSGHCFYGSIDGYTP